MSDLVRPGQPGESPFDAIRHVDEYGEYWLARELMPLLGYDKWERFAEAVERARTAIANSGQDPDSACSRLREDVATRGNTPDTIRSNYRMTRYGAYMAALNGDSRKPEVAAAQTYFAVKTREAEVMAEQASTLPAVIEVPLDDYEKLLAGGQQLLARMREQQREIESQRQELDDVHAYADHLKPDAEAFRNIVQDDGRDWKVKDAAAFVSRSDRRIRIGQDQLFAKLREWGLLDKWNQPYSNRQQNYVTSIPTQFTHPRTGERIDAAKKQVRVTWEGLSYIRRKLLDGIEKAEAEKRRTQEPDLFSAPNITKLPARRGKRNGPGSGDATPTGA